MFNVGGGEVVVILLIALIVLGPDKLPAAARQAGKYLNEFRRMSAGFQDEIRNAMDLADQTTTNAPPADPTPQYLPPAEPSADSNPAEPIDATPTTPDTDPGPGDPSAA